MTVITSPRYPDGHAKSTLCQMADFHLFCLSSLVQIHTCLRFCSTAAPLSISFVPTSRPQPVSSVASSDPSVPVEILPDSLPGLPLPEIPPSHGGVCSPLLEPSRSVSDPSLPSLSQVKQIGVHIGHPTPRPPRPTLDLGWAPGKHPLGTSLSLLALPLGLCRNVS